jgi:tetratricopeptide (TPR) repeat protein
MRRTRAFGLCLLAVLSLPSPGLPADDAATAKTLFFDRKYAEARSAWQRVQLSSAPEREAAAYYVARCSENLGELERALKEYGDYLARRPSDSVLVDEARTSRVGLAAKLYKAGARQHLAILKEALGDRSRQVRYYAAFQVGGLGDAEAHAAVPVLREILAKESDADLVERAKLILMRLDPKALAVQEAPPGPGAARVSWLKVRIFEKGRPTPELSVNLPVGLAELVFKSLPEDAKRELGRRGYAEENFWDRIHKLGPMQILDVDDGEGGRVQIWTE